MPQMAAAARIITVTNPPASQRIRPTDTPSGSCPAGVVWESCEVSAILGYALGPDSGFRLEGRWSRRLPAQQPGKQRQPEGANPHPGGEIQPEKLRVMKAEAGNDLPVDIQRLSQQDDGRHA